MTAVTGRTATCDAEVELGPGPAWLCCDFPPSHTDQHYDSTAKVRWGSGELAENRDATRQAVHDALAAFAAELDQLADNYDPRPRIPAEWHIHRVRAIRNCATVARFRAAQARDGLPDPDTGISHCKACHGVDLDPHGPRCGHTFGCPEC
jgi:hypothetical protein